METTNEIQIQELLDNIRDKEKALYGKLQWIRLRCLLETEASVVNDEASYSNADNLMNRFIAKYCIEEDNVEKKDEIIKFLKQEELENCFYDFLATVEQDAFSQNVEQDKLSQSWNQNAKVFIDNLCEYRQLGALDLNLSGQLIEYAKKINNDPLRYIYELIQNADDCEYHSAAKIENDKQLIQVTITIQEDSLIITYPEDGMTSSDIIAITTIGQSNKRKKKKKRIIGEKGRGFKTIFSVCDCAEIHSGPFHFSLSQNRFFPMWIPNQPEEQGTKMHLHFKKGGEKEFQAGEKLFDSIKERYGFSKECNHNQKNIMKNCPIIFTNKIEKLVIKYGEETLYIQKEKSIPDQRGNRRAGDLTIAYSIQTNGDKKELTKLKCYWLEKDVKFSYAEYISHYKGIFRNEEEFQEAEEGVVTYPIILIAPKMQEEEENRQDLKEWKGNMFTYLPTFININAPISIHAPFELNEDRSCMWISGMNGDEHLESDYEDGYHLRKEGNYTTKWNRRLFSELFVDQCDNMSLLKYAYEYLVSETKDGRSVSIYDYLPAYQTNDHNFFQSQDEKYAECVRLINLLCKEGLQNIIFENFKMLNFLHSLVGERLFCVKDGPLFFDETIDSILQSIEEEEKRKEIGCIWTKYVDDRNHSQDDVPIIRSIKQYPNIIALGVKYAADVVKEESKEKARVEFANELLKHAYPGTIVEIAKPQDCSEYLPQKGKREELRAIKIAGEFLRPKDAELWIFSEQGGCKKRYLNVISKYTGVENQEGKKIEICGIYEGCFNNYVQDKHWDNVWNYIYSKNGNEEEIKCSFGLYKELMCLFGNTKDWYAYSENCLETKADVSAENGKKEFFIPADTIKTIWRNQYEDYRECEGNDLSQSICDEKNKAERLGIRCFNETENKNGVYHLLPIAQWTKEICEELNKTDFSKNYEMISEEGLVSKDDFKDRFSNLKKVNKSVSKVFVYDALPVPYVRFHNKVILQKDSDIDAIVKEIESSIVENLGIVSKFDIKKEELLNKDEPITWNTWKNYKEDLKCLTDICAIAAKFTINKRPTSGADNQVWYELLQNANDHITSADSSKEIKISLNDKDQTFTLEYPDKGFSVRDFLAICTEGNSGNVLSDENREGRKGTGFKSVYNLFDRVTITSGPVQCVLKDVERDIIISPDEKITVKDLENANKSDKHYPIPEFSYLENLDSEKESIQKTKIIFHSPKDLSKIKELILGSSQPDEKTGQEGFIKKEDYLFLDKIEKIAFELDGQGLKLFERDKYVRENYFRKEYTYEFTIGNGESPAWETPIWKNRSKAVVVKHFCNTCG